MKGTVELDAPSLEDVMRRAGRLKVTCQACQGVGYPIVERVAFRLGWRTPVTAAMPILCAHCGGAQTTVMVEFDPA